MINSASSRVMPAGSARCRQLIPGRDGYILTWRLRPRFQQLSAKLMFKLAWSG